MWVNILLPVHSKGTDRACIIENSVGSHMVNYTAKFIYLFLQTTKCTLKDNYGIFENLLNSQK
jgi:hypothetical protein